MGLRISEETMKCIICRHGELKPGITSLMFEKDGSTIVMKEVPVDVCDNCGEAYVPDNIAEKIMEQIEFAVRQGIIVDVRNFSPKNPAICS